MLPRFSLVKGRTYRECDPCIALPGNVHLATLLGTLTSKSNLAFKTQNEMIYEETIAIHFLLGGGGLAAVLSWFFLCKGICQFSSQFEKH